MGECPFCSAEIDEEVMLYGGTCSACLIDIPGEEAPTDPGVDAVTEEAQTATALALATGKTSPHRNGLIAAGVAALVLIGVGIYASVGGQEEWAPRTVSAVDGSAAAKNGSGTTGGEPGDESGSVGGDAGAADVGESAEDQDGSLASTAGATDGSVAETSSQGSGRSSVASTRGTSKTGGEQKVEESYDEPTLKSEVVTGGSGQSTVNVRRDTSLETEAVGSDQATAYVSSMNSRVGKKFLACVQEHRFGGNEATGKVRLSYTVQTDGSVTDIRVDPTPGLKDPSLTKCFGAATDGIKFPEFKDSTPVAQTMGPY